MKKDFPYLKSLTVEEVKCFREKGTLELSRDRKPTKWTIILGNNGTGKTTLLRSIVLLEPEKFMGISLVPKEASDKIKVKYWPKFFISRKNSLPRDSKSDFYLEIAYGDDKSFISGVKNKSVQENLIDTDLDFSFYAYGSSRRISSSALSTEDSNDLRFSNLFDDSELPNAEEWLMQTDYAVKNKAVDAKNRLEKIKKLLIDILPDVKGFVFETSDNFKNSVSAVTDYGNIPLRDLSHGYLTMMAWVLDFARRMFERFPESENPLAEPAICLVDEIDLHLHPSWQRRIIQDLDFHFPNTQFIVTSHSPLIVQAAPSDANIVLLKKDNQNGVTIHNHMEVIRNWRVDQILTSDLFGLETARPPQVEEAIKKRAELLSQTSLTAKEEELVYSLEKQIGDLPVGETAEDIKAMELIRKAASKLK